MARTTNEDASIDVDCPYPDTRDIGGSRDARARLLERGFLYSLMNISFHRSRRAVVSSVGHAFMSASKRDRDRARFFFNDRKKPSEGANRVTELRDRIKTA